MSPGIRTVAVVGTGVIGASWAALCLSRGLDVLAHDPSPDAEQWLRGAAPDRLTFVAGAAEAVVDADFVQESGPEVESLKSAIQDLFLSSVRAPRGIVYKW